MYWCSREYETTFVAAPRSNVLSIMMNLMFSFWDSVKYEERSLNESPCGSECVDYDRTKGEYVCGVIQTA